MPSRSYLNTVLTIIAVLLGLNLLVQVTGLPSGNSAAHAQTVTGQPETVTSPPFNAAEQRKQMIAVLDSMNRRLTSIETKLDRGLSVKVTEMPAVKITEMPPPPR